MKSQFTPTNYFIIENLTEKDIKNSQNLNDTILRIKANLFYQIFFDVEYYYFQYNKLFLNNTFDIGFDITTAISDDTLKTIQTLSKTDTNNTTDPFYSVKFQNKDYYYYCITTLLNFIYATTNKKEPEDYFRKLNS